MANPHNHESVVNELRSKTPIESARRARRTVMTPQPVDVPQVEPVMVMSEPEVEQMEEVDLDAEIDRIMANISQPPEQETQAPMSTEEMLRMQILEMLHNRKDAPSVEQIAAWKKKYGENGVQVIAFDPDNVYIFTHLTYNQWEKLQEAQRKGGPDIAKAMTDTVLKMAILWPKLSPDHFGNNRAGLYQTLYEQVLVNSYFLSPQQAITLTTRL